MGTLPITIENYVPVLKLHVLPDDFTDYRVRCFLYRMVF